MVEYCIEGIMDVVDAGAGMLMLIPEFEHMDHQLAAAVIPALRVP